MIDLGNDVTLVVTSLGFAVSLRDSHGTTLAEIVLEDEEVGAFLRLIMHVQRNAAGEAT